MFLNLFLDLRLYFHYFQRLIAYYFYWYLYLFIKIYKKSGVGGLVSTYLWFLIYFLNNQSEMVLGLVIIFELFQSLVSFGISDVALFWWELENCQIIAPAEGGTEGSDRLLLTYNPSCMPNSYTLQGMRYLVWMVPATKQQQVECWVWTIKPTVLGWSLDQLDLTMVWPEPLIIIAWNHKMFFFLNNHSCLSYKEWFWKLITW